MQKLSSRTIFLLQYTKNYFFKKSRAFIIIACTFCHPVLAHALQPPLSADKVLFSIENLKNVTLDSNKSPLVVFKFTAEQRISVAIKTESLIKNADYNYNFDNSYKIEILAANGDSIPTKFYFNREPRHFKVTTFLVPSGHYEMKIFLTKNAREKYWKDRIKLKIDVLGVEPKPLTNALSNFTEMLTPLSLDPNYIDLIDYRHKQPPFLDSQDDAISSILLPSVAHGFDLHARLTAKSKDLLKENDPSGSATEVLKAYHPESKKSGRISGLPPPYYKDRIWISKYNVPQIVVLMPSIKNHDLLKKIDWLTAISQLSVAMKEPVTQIAIIFDDQCDVTAITMPSEGILNLDYGFGCAMIASRGELSAPEIDLSIVLPAFLKTFLPSGAKIQFNRRTIGSAEVIIRTVRGHAINGGSAWERIEMIFNTERKNDKSAATSLQVVADIKLSHTIGEYPRDSQFTDLADGADVQSYVRKLIDAFEQFVKIR